MSTREEPGLGVDARGNPVIDPTANVLQLVQAAIARLDDLREVGLRHVNEISAGRGEYEQKLREAEAGRIDAIRAVDVQAVQRAADVQAAQAATLATQVTDTAAAFALALDAALVPIKKDIADLRQVQYETAGGKAQTIETGTSRNAVAGIAVAAAAIIVSAGLYLVSHAKQPTVIVQTPTVPTQTTTTP